MRTPLGAIVVATLTSLAIVAPTAAEEELYAGEYVDRESVPGVTHEILSDKWLEYGDDHSMQVRTTLEPGAGIPASVFSGYWASTVESGELTVVARDRGGRLLDARMPTACELDWAWAGTPYREDVAFVAGGPYLPGSRLMVGWMSFPCGPDAIIDVGEGLRAIKVIDRYHGGCDSSGEWHDVALSVRSSDAIESEEILGRVIRQ